MSAISGHPWKDNFSPVLPPFPKDFIIPEILLSQPGSFVHTVLTAIRGSSPHTHIHYRALHPLLEFSSRIVTLNEMVTLASKVVGEIIKITEETRMTRQSKFRIVVLDQTDIKEILLRI